MAVDLTIILPDRPGALAQVARAIADAGININAASTFRARPGEMWGTFHILVEDGTKAREVAEAAGAQVSEEREVLVIEVEDRVGSLADIAENLQSEGHNLDLIYLAPGNRLVIGTDDLHRAKVGINTMQAHYH